MRTLRHILCWIAVGLLLTACNVTRKFQAGEYLVQKVTIESDKEVPRKERITSEELKNYLRQRPNKRLFGTNFFVWLHNQANPEKDNWWNNLKRKHGQAPVILDTILTEQSAINFKNYMDSRGFFSSKVSYEIDTTRREHRAYISYRTRQGKPYRISSFSYSFRDHSLAPLILSDSANTLIRVGEIYDLATLQAERERITTYLKKRGYYHFSVNNIEYVADTLEAPYTIGLRLVVKQQITGYDETGKAVMADNTRYFIDRINIFPQYDPTKLDQQLLAELDTNYYHGLYIISRQKPIVRPKVLRELVPIHQGLIYNGNSITNTYDRLMSTGYFKSARIIFTERPERTLLIDTVQMADTTAIRRVENGFLGCNILCTPTLKQSYKIELEGSMTSSFWGLKATAGYQNRNIFRGIEALDLDVTMGYEYMRAPDAKKRNALEFGFSGGLSIPRFLLPFSVDKNKLLTSPRTRINLSINFQDRPYYRRTLSNASWGYSWDLHNHSFVIRPADITIVDMGYMDEEFYNSLQNRYLQNSYSSQLISALSFNYVFNSQRRNLTGNATVVRINAEVAGNLLDGLTHLFGSPAEGKDYHELFGIRYSQYFRIESSVSHKIMLGEKTALAGRLYAGCGVAYGNAEALPMDRLFYAGGSNSMRGWTPRTLGPGTTPTPENMLYPTQLGDMRLEANLEFRFPIWGIFHGATFFDVGNIWFLKENNAEYSPDAVFRGDFYKELGFNTGIGIRLDIKFAILRLDCGIQLHNPNNPAGERWIQSFKWKNTALNFGVGYPF